MNGQIYPIRKIYYSPAEVKEIVIKNTLMTVFFTAAIVAIMMSMITIHVYYDAKHYYQNKTAQVQK